MSSTDGAGGGEAQGNASGKRIAFIGGGNMARAILQGLTDAGRNPACFAAGDPDPACRAAIQALGIRAVADNQAAVQDADLVVLAVKPQAARAALSSFSLAPHRLLLSLCAGLPMAAIAELTSAEQPIVRCMPNTPALLRAGVTALHANLRVRPPQRQLAEALLGALGKTLWVEEEAQLDAVTALSGSGPAYFFYLMEAMTAAGQRLGLAPELAATLTLETAYGAARMARETGTGLAALRRSVTSPGGVTERAMASLEANDVHGRLAQAVELGCVRARELAKEFLAP